MSNIDKAADILAEAGAYCGECCFGECGEPDCPRDADWRGCPDCAAAVTGYAHALADTGLLAPDLPEPDKDSPFPGTSWEVYKEHGGAYSVTSRNGLVYAPGDAHSPTEARAMALALLAAADHADRRG